jgi:cysteine synthase
MNEMSSATLSDAGVLSAIGKTPLVRLTNIFKNCHFKLFAKLEMLNPGGSIKDRTALSILRNGVELGCITPGTVVIESTSGNMGIGLAQACALMGLRFICVVDPKTTQQNIRILKAYGAEISAVTEPDPLTGEYLQARIDRVQQLLCAIPDSFWPNQYSNIYNARAHYTTMQEVIDALGEPPDYLFCATSTCGTIRGCAEFIREHNLTRRLVGGGHHGCAEVLRADCERRHLRRHPPRPRRALPRHHLRGRLGGRALWQGGAALAGGGAAGGVRHQRLVNGRAAAPAPHSTSHHTV